MGVIKMNKETSLGSDQIENNMNELKNKLRGKSVPFYQHLYSAVDDMPIYNLTWKKTKLSVINRTIAYKSKKKRSQSGYT